MPRLEVGDQAPNFTLPVVAPADFQAGENSEGRLETGQPLSSTKPQSDLLATELTLSQLLATAKRGVVVYFYPRASTPGCTTEACDFRDSINSLKGAGFQVIGISPDRPAALEKFITTQQLNFPLASDIEHEVMATWGAWGEKKNYGKIVTGTIRSTVVINPEGKVIWAGYNIRAKGHVARLRKELGID